MYHQLRKTENFDKVSFRKIACVFSLDVAKCNSIQHRLQCVNV